MQLAVYVALGLGFVGSALLSLPAIVVDRVSRSTPEVIFSVETGERVLALSIDDGPSEATAEILEVLREHEAAATFFVIGEHMEAGAAGADILPQLLADGHELGHHMMTDTPSRELEPKVFHDHFDRMHDLLEPVQPTRLFRPGSGWYDDRMLEAVASRGYQTVLGSVYPFDAHVPWTGFLSWFVLQNVHPGAIVVLHDGADRGPRTAEVLRAILPELTRQGYRVVTVSTLLEMSGSE
jgi:peptidoglycan-N-acetylglucosamine deacetylase